MAPDQGGGWLVGPQDHSGATLAITGDAMSSWYYSPAQMSIKVAVSCAGVAMPGIDPVIEPGIDPATPGREQAAVGSAIVANGFADGLTQGINRPITGCG